MVFLIALPRSFFLLARGELFHAFIEEAAKYLHAPPSLSTQQGTYSLKVHFSDSGSLLRS
jgi:hypothetical protein